MVSVLLFWISLFLIIYIYIGYAALLLVVSYFVKQKKTTDPSGVNLPEVTLFVAAWNEHDFVHNKVQNSLVLDYPEEKLKLLWVTDGSDDGTPELLSQYPRIKILHEQQRNGKIGAMNRGMQFVKTPIVVFCDANTYLNKDAIKQIVASFSDPKVGCVAGEKRIFSSEKDNASGSGEGFYWKIESFIKKTESKISSTVGAAGELFAIRTSLFEPVEQDTILDDFVISMKIALKGYSVIYNPQAIATETSSASVKDELKRKIRIAAGGIQTLFRLKALLNPIPNFWFWFTYISHKVLRWVVLPFAFITVFSANYSIVLLKHHSLIYDLAYLSQILFYVLGIIGFLLQNKSIKNKIFFIPYYLLMMNWAILMGILKQFLGKQHVNWERSKRAPIA